ncbi:MAG: tetratricopeptide repeat protein, partial [Candidatus Marinimicrobia bacterium]|nr:tetratricopeptide repeat protein [Candidatus Neomarinimicrobiota bacterium]
MKLFYRLSSILLSTILVLSCGQFSDNDSHVREIISHRSLGLAYLEEGELTAAVEEFQQLIETAPKEALGYANLGLTYLRMGEFEQAENQVRAAIKRDNNNPDIRAILALIYEMSNRQQQAIEVLETSLDQNPDHVMSLYNLVQFYAKSGENTDLDQARQYLQTIAEIHPGNIAARLQLVEVLVQLGQQDAAITHLEYLRQLIPEIPENAQQVLRRAVSQIRDGNMQQAFPSVRIFHNLLKSSDFYQAAILQMKGPGGPLTGSPILHFSRDYDFDRKHRQTLIDAINFEEVTAESNLEKLVNAGASESAAALFALTDYDNDGDIDLYLSRFDTAQLQNDIYLMTNENGVFQNTTAGSGLRHPGKDLDAI